MGIKERGMKFGVNTFVWVSPCTTAAVKELAPKAKGLGFDVFEISVENPALLDVQQLVELLIYLEWLHPIQLYQLLVFQ